MNGKIPRSGFGYTALFTAVMAVQFFCTGPLLAHESGIIELRELYYRSYKEKAPAEQLLSMTANATYNDPVVYGYKAVASIMMCNHAANPYTKLKYFYSGKSDLERAIKMRSASAELRYLRFAVQSNTPAILNYKDNIKEDKKALLAYLSVHSNKEIDKDLYSRIGKYLSLSKELTAAEREHVRANYLGQ